MIFRKYTCLVVKSLLSQDRKQYWRISKYECKSYVIIFPIKANKRHILWQWYDRSNLQAVKMFFYFCTVIIWISMKFKKYYPIAYANVSRKVCFKCKFVIFWKSQWPHGNDLIYVWNMHSRQPRKNSGMVIRKKTILSFGFLICTYRN